MASKSPRSQVPEVNSILNELKSFREKKGLTQFDLSSLIGKAPTYTGQIEQGRIGTSMDIILQLEELGFVGHHEVNERLKSEIYHVDNNLHAGSSNAPMLLHETTSENGSMMLYDLTMNTSREGFYGSGVQVCIGKLAGNITSGDQLVLGNKIIIPLQNHITIKTLASNSDNRKPTWDIAHIQPGEAYRIDAGMLHTISHDTSGSAEFLQITQDPRGRMGVIHPDILQENDYTSYHALTTGLLPRLKYYINKSSLSDKDIVAECNKHFPNVPCTVSTLKNIKKYAVNPSIDLIYVICSVLDIGVEQVIKKAPQTESILLADSIPFPLDKENEYHIEYKYANTGEDIMIEAGYGPRTLYVQQGNIYVSNTSIERVYNKLLMSGTGLNIGEKANIKLQAITDSVFFVVS